MGDLNKIVHDGARASILDSFIRGKDLRLAPVNKLEQLRKYIFDIEITNSNKFQIKKKYNFSELVKLFRSKVYHRGIHPFYGSSIERNNKRYVAAILRRLRITEVMSKPNDSKQR